jgi:hypothetical protein
VRCMSCLQVIRIDVCEPSGAQCIVNSLIHQAGAQCIKFMHCMWGQEHLDQFPSICVCMSNVNPLAHGQASGSTLGCSPNSPHLYTVGHTQST